MRHQPPPLLIGAPLRGGWHRRAGAGRSLIPGALAVKKPLRPSGRARNSASLPTTNDNASSIAPPDGAPSTQPRGPRNHRWTLDGAAQVATCDPCGCVRRVRFDLSGGRLATRVDDTGPEKCPGRRPEPPPPSTCAAGAWRWWWFTRPWSQPALPLDGSTDGRPTCAAQVSREGTAAGGLPVETVGGGWTIAARARRRPRAASQASRRGAPSAARVR